MNVKLTPNKEMLAALNPMVDGRKVLYIMCEANSTDEYNRAEHLREANKKRIKPIKCITNGKVYATIKDAVDDIPWLSAGSISKVVNGKQLNTKGYIFKYQ